LLFDMGVAGDFVGAFAPYNVQKSGAGTFGSQTNRFFPREVELSFFGQVDPFARAEVRIEASQSAPGPDTGVSLAEANLTLLTLPYGFQAKLGQMRNRYGLTNPIHEHDLPFVDRPNVLRNFFGDDGLVEKGVEVTWVPDFLPFYLEALAGVFNGDNETAFGYGRINQPLVTGRLRTFFELSDTSAIQIGISGANGQTAIDWAVEPYVTFFPSEFIRFRLAYKNTERDRTQISPFNQNNATARAVNEVFFQATFILGAHPAHPF